MPNSTLYILHSTFKSIVYFAFYILIALAITSCSSSTKPKTGTISGRVMLVNDTGNPSLDPLDFSGVTVALYNQDVLDTTLIRLNNEYPQIGVSITQQTEFDHRNQDPIAVTETDLEGHFIIDEIVPSTYNVVVMKQGWGCKCFYNVEISGDSNITLNSNDPVVLEPETILNGYIDSSISFLTDKVYRITDDTTIIGPVVIQQGTLILVDPGKRLNIFSDQLQITGEQSWRVSSSHKFYDIGVQQEIHPFGRVFFRSDVLEIVIRNMIMEYATDGLVLTGKGSQLTNCIIRYSLASALTTTSTQTRIDKSLFYNNPINGVETRNSVDILRSVFIGSEDACRFFESSGIVSDNYFLSNGIALRPFQGNASINNNCFDENQIAVSICAADPEIELNSFFSNLLDVELNRYYVQNSFLYCNPSIRSNNFFDGTTYISLSGNNSVYGVGNGIAVVNDQHYPQNYWKLINPYDRIIDGNFPGSDIPYIVTIEPRVGNPISAAGIR